MNRQKIIYEGVRLDDGTASVSGRDPLLIGGARVRVGSLAVDSQRLRNAVPCSTQVELLGLDFAVLDRAITLRYIPPIRYF